MNHFSNVTGWQKADQSSTGVALDFLASHEASGCGVDCYLQQQTTRRQRCFCDYLAMVDAYVNDLEPVEAAASMRDGLKLDAPLEGDLQLKVHSSPEADRSTSNDRLRWAADAWAENLTAVHVHETRLHRVRRLPENDLSTFLDDPDEEIRELAFNRLLVLSRQHIDQLMDEQSDKHGFPA